ncbi:MAG: type II toxin-antitoxin system Phd/YefM family antitoxin [Candidatus Aminicenantaceae bacterium]
MESTSVSIAEGKKHFSRLLQKAAEKKEEITITKRGKPVAVLVPYEEYKQSRKLNACRKIREARKYFARAGIKAEEVYKQSKKQLEDKS